MGGESLDFWNQAVDVNEEIRQGQTKELLRFVESSCSDSDLVVLSGDFNFDETDDSYKFVTEANFTDTGAKEGQDVKKRVTWGHPENKWGNSPAYLIDYVFVRSNNELCVEGSSTIPEKDFQFPHYGVLHSISDHSPVVADILISESRLIQDRFEEDRLYKPD